MNTLINICQIWFYELKEVCKDEGIMIFIFFVPLAYPLLYAYVYTNEVVREIPAAVVDDCHSSLSREFIRNIDATPETSVIAHCPNMAEAQQLIKRHEIYGIYHIPSSFDRDLWRGDQTRVGLYCDMSSMLYYKGLILSANNVALDMNRDIKARHYIPTTTDREEQVAKMPVDYEYVPLYNPQSGFSAFLIPPVLMLIIQQTIFLGIGMSMGRGRENYRRNFTQLKNLYTAPGRIVAGKACFYFMVYLVMAVYMFTVVNHLFGLPTLGHYCTFIAFIVPYLLACIFLAIVLSVLVYRREDCIMLFVSLSVPMLFLSGVTWPAETMPTFWRYVSYLFPSTFGMNGYVHISSMGASIQDVAFHYRGLWIQTAVYFFAACALYKWRIHLVKQRLPLLEARSSTCA
ncbi:MAG: ABC transporter permease [Bacteroidales bacterium]|nr:ABC transporter permease [Bacteroidales bacterium]